MGRRAVTPSPLNLFTTWIVYLVQLSRSNGTLQSLLQPIPFNFHCLTTTTDAGESTNTNTLHTRQEHHGQAAQSSPRVKKWWLRKFQQSARIRPRGTRSRTCIQTNRVALTLIISRPTYVEADGIAFSRHPLSSQMSIVGDRRTVENVTDWVKLVKRYTSSTNVSD